MTDRNFEKKLRQINSKQAIVIFYRGQGFTNEQIGDLKLKKKSGEPTSEAAVRYHLRIIYKDLGISDLGDDEKEDLLEGEIYDELEKIVEEILKKEDLKNYDDALKYFPYPVLGKEKDHTHEVMEDVLGKKEEEEEKPTIPPHPYSDYTDVVNKTEEIQEEDDSTDSDPATEDLEVTPPLEEPSEETPQGDEDLGDDEPSEPEEDEERIVDIPHGIEPEPTPPPTQRQIPTLAVIIGAISACILAICLCATAVYMGNTLGYFGREQTEVNTPTIEDLTKVVGQPTEEPVIVEPTEVPSEIIEPTDVPTLEPTAIPTPIPPTNTPAPSIALPFADNFDAGMRSEWKTIYGNWYTADGKLTVFEERLKWQFIVLDDPTWTNYNISLDTHIPVLGSANQGEVSIIIRYSRLRQEQIYFYLGRISGAGWVVGNPQEIHPKYISERENRASIQDNNHIQLEAYGNNFTAYINGSFVQTISINGFDNGGVMLGIRCNNEGTCPSIDNILIEPIN